MGYLEYPKWITDRSGGRRIVQDRSEEEAHKPPPELPPPPLTELEAAGFVFGRHRWDLPESASDKRVKRSHGKRGRLATRRT